MTRSVSVRKALHRSTTLTRATRCVIEQLETRALMTAAGDLDTTFGVGGIVNGFGTSNTAAWYYNDMTVLPDGKYLAVGQMGSSMSSFGIIRFNADGTPDTTFGTNGLTTSRIFSNSTQSATELAVQSDGKILLTGYGA